MIICLYIIVGGLSDLACQERRGESLQPLLLLFLLAELTMESKFVVLAYHVKRLMLSNTFKYYTLVVHSPWHLTFAHG